MLKDSHADVMSAFTALSVPKPDGKPSEISPTHVSAALFTSDGPVISTTPAAAAPPASFSDTKAIVDVLHRAVDALQGSMRLCYEQQLVIKKLDGDRMTAHPVQAPSAAADHPVPVQLSSATCQVLAPATTAVARRPVSVPQLIAPRLSPTPTAAPGGTASTAPLLPSPNSTNAIVAQLQQLQQQLQMQLQFATMPLQMVQEVAKRLSGTQVAASPAVTPNSTTTAAGGVATMQCSPLSTQSSPLPSLTPQVERHASQTDSAVAYTAGTPALAASVRTLSAPAASDPLSVLATAAFDILADDARPSGSGSTKEPHMPSSAANANDVHRSTPHGDGCTRSMSRPGTATASRGAQGMAALTQAARTQAASPASPVVVMSPSSKPAAKAAKKIRTSRRCYKCETTSSPSWRRSHDRQFECVPNRPECLMLLPTLWLLIWRSLPPLCRLCEACANASDLDTTPA